jgi:hypothetical protein
MDRICPNCLHPRPPMWFRRRDGRVCKLCRIRDLLRKLSSIESRLKSEEDYAQRRYRDKRARSLAIAGERR